MNKIVLFALLLVGSVFFPQRVSANTRNVAAANSGSLYGSIVFNEILANNLPGQQEFIEFYNRSEITFQLEGWKFYYGDKPYNLPQVSIAPGEYFVLCKTTAVSSFPPNLKVIGVPSFPTLANAGKLLYLENKDGVLVSMLEYSDKMYGDPAKKNGGWSLECIDPDNLGGTAFNWTSSVDPSGMTPVRLNSVKASNPDREIPIVSSVSMFDSNVLRFVFSKPMNQATLLDKQSYKTNNPDYTVTGLQVSYPTATELEVTFDLLPPPGVLLELGMDGVRDLSGFSLGDGKVVIIGSGEEADSLDIVINELLFNAPTGGEEYIELYNRSDKMIDLRYLSVATRKADGSMNTFYALSSKPEFLAPGQYLIVTKNMDLVCGFYNCAEAAHFVQLPVAPALNNTAGTLILLNNHTGKVVDEFSYNEKMQDAGIKDKKGVALERLSADLPTLSSGNWKSASADSGYGTPGSINSQHKSAPAGIEEGVSILYPDGLQGADLYNVYYRFSTAGNRCRVMLYDSTGKLADQIVNNEILGTEGSLSWSRGTLHAGIYIIYMEVYDLKGSVKKYKLPVVLK